MRRLRAAASIAAVVAGTFLLGSNLARSASIASAINFGSGVTRLVFRKIATPTVFA